MSWYCSRTCKCKNCGHIYSEEVSTFSIGKVDFGKCPKCGGEVEEVTNQNKNNKFIEKLKKAYSEN